MNTDPDNCRTVNGDFGLLDGEPLVVKFHYAVELDREFSEQDYRSNVVPSVEVSMNDYLVSALFDEATCMNEQPTERRTLRESPRALASILGISARPLDTVQDDVDCTGEFCFGMLGQVSLYLDSKSGRRRLQDGSSKAEQLRGTLRRGMNDGRFDNNPPIVKVSYIELAEEEGNGDEVEATKDKEESSVDNTVDVVRVVWFTILGILFAAAIVYVVLRKRRMRRNGAGAETFEPLSPAASRVSNSGQGAGAPLSLSGIAEDDSSNDSQRNSDGAADFVVGTGEDSSAQSNSAENEAHVTW